MLASITPLGERSRGSRWGITASWFVVGATAGGTLCGLVIGELGALVATFVEVGPTLRALAIGVAAAAAGAFDLSGRPVPSTPRQVNAYWLGRYRGWVVGSGFGLQLGIGVGTIVTTASVYAVLFAALISADPIVGALICGTFGLARGAGALPAAVVRTPTELLAMSGWVERNTSLARVSAGALAALLGAVTIVTSI